MSQSSRARRPWGLPEKGDTPNPAGYPLPPTANRQVSTPWPSGCNTLRKTWHGWARNHHTGLHVAGRSTCDEPWKKSAPPAPPPPLQCGIKAGEAGQSLLSPRSSSEGRTPPSEPGDSSQREALGPSFPHSLRRGYWCPVRAVTPPEGKARKWQPRTKGHSSTPLLICGIPRSPSKPSTILGRATPPLWDEGSVGILGILHPQRASPRRTRLYKSV